MNTVVESTKPRSTQRKGLVMNQSWKIVLTAAAAVAVLSTGTVLYAQTDKSKTDNDMSMQTFSGHEQYDGDDGPDEPNGGELRQDDAGHDTTKGHRYAYA